MTKIYILIAVLSAFVLAGCTRQINSIKNKSKAQINNVVVKNKFIFKQKNFDFGLIKQSGGKVSHKFSFTYVGKDPIRIIAAPASCGCTSATVAPSSLKPGESGVVTVSFNPNLHAEPQGKFFKTVSLVTDPPLKNSPELKIWASIDLDLGPQAFESKDSHEEINASGQGESIALAYKTITAEQFSKMLQHKDFTLIDVHVPLQQHIKGTDLVIPYNQINKYRNELPKNKNAKIVVYCRSGHMSAEAAQVLMQQGYTNVYDLMGGKIAYDKFLSSK